MIAGQNGTSKSTILGMLGQPFGLRDRRTIFSKPFSTKFTDIFNMSPEHDIPGEHLYYVDFNDEAIAGSQGQHVQVKSFKRPAKTSLPFALSPVPLALRARATLTTP